jgi:hypothetical protein
MSVARLLVVTGALIAVAACGGPSVSGNEVVADALAPIPGFIQTISTTKCWLGADVEKQNLPGYTLWVGAEGVFSVDKANQRSFCETNPWRPLHSPRAAVEGEEVKMYLLGAGLPASQVGSIRYSYSFDTSGETYVTAIVARQIDGIPAPDSSAFASLIGAQSVSEGVYWPALSASVSEELSELKAIVDDPERLAGFQAKLPKGFVSGSIVIHHTCGDARVPGRPGAEVKIEGHACYDAVIAGNGDLGSTVCYLPTGEVFTPAPC